MEKDTEEENDIITLDYSNTKHLELIQKDHVIADEQLYAEDYEKESNQQSTCGKKLQLFIKKISNLAIDYFEWDRLYNGEGKPKVQLSKCYKRYAQSFDEEYSEKKLKFAYTYQYVEEERKKEEIRKHVSFRQELYRFICCIKGHEIRQIQEACIPQERYQKILKEKQANQPSANKQQQNSNQIVKIFQKYQINKQKKEKILSLYEEEDNIQYIFEQSEPQNNNDRITTNVNTQIISIKNTRDTNTYQTGIINNDNQNPNGTMAKGKEQDGYEDQNIYDRYIENDEDQIKKPKIIKKTKRNTANKSIEKDEAINKKKSNETIVSLNKYTTDDTLNNDLNEIIRNYDEKNNEEIQQSHVHNTNQDFQEKNNIFTNNEHKQTDRNYQSKKYDNNSANIYETPKEQLENNHYSKQQNSYENKDHLGNIDSIANVDQIIYDYPEQNGVKKMRKTRKNRSTMPNIRPQQQIQVELNKIDYENHEQTLQYLQINDYQQGVAQKKKRKKRNKLRDLEEDNSEMIIEETNTYNPNESSNKRYSPSKNPDEKIRQPQEQPGKVEKKRRRGNKKRQIIEQNHEQIIQFDEII